MPVIRDINDSDFRCCVWQVTETMEELLAMLPNKGYELYEEAQQRFSSPKRRQEFIAVRVLLYQMQPGAVIGYYDNGKPYLAHSCWRISISHTGGYVAVILSDCGEVGVDIEQYGERVCRVASHFINDDEQVIGVWKQLLLWSAKETVYKMMNCREVDFRKHLISSDWQPKPITGPECKGFMRMRTFYPAHQKTYQVYFETTERFVLTYSFVMDY